MSRRPLRSALPTALLAVALSLTACGPGEEDDAHTAGELSAMAALEELGVAWRRLRSTVTCTDDVRVRRR